jgi:hypothetical protein
MKVFAFFDGKKLKNAMNDFGNHMEKTSLRISFVLLKKRKNN